MRVGTIFIQNIHDFTKGKRIVELPTLTRQLKQTKTQQVITLLTQST